MWKNYSRLAWRNLLKDKVFSLINILGLAIGIAACIMILQYVHFEMSYDDFHTKAPYLYRLNASEIEGTGRETTLNPPPIGPELQRNYSEVIDFARLILPWSGQAATSTLAITDIEGNTIKQNFVWGFYTDPGFLKMFAFPFIKGNHQNALDGANKVVLAESTARKLFGNDWEENDRIIGQSVEYINEFDRFLLEITGVIADTPENSHFQYDFLASFATLSTGWGKDYAETWNGNPVYTYLQLTPDIDINSFSRKINDYVSFHRPDRNSPNLTFSLQPLQDIYLHSHREAELKVNGNATYVYFLCLIAVLILLIALVNYVNLTTAKAVARSSEVGLRKAMGALRPQLIKQFLFESLLVNGSAFVLAIMLLLLVSPFYEQLTGRALNYDDSGIWWFILLLFPINTLLSGSYPAFILSAYNPIQVLKGKSVYSPKGKQLRKGLVVFQFGVSMTMIIFAIAMYQQLNFMRTNDPGFSREGVVVVKGPGNRAETWIEHDRQKSNLEENDPFKEAVSRFAGVRGVSLAWSIPGEKSSISSISLGTLYDNSMIDVVITDNDYAEVYGLELLAGQFNTDNGFVINERTVEVLGYRDPDAALGQVFRDDRDLERNIQGVVKNYHHHSLHHGIQPLIFAKNDPTYKLDSYYSIKIDGKNMDGILGQIEAAYEKVYTYDPFEYFFIDSYFEAQYREDSRFSKIIGIFSGLTVLIACLGLFGLSLHTGVEKTKEIGIRKVLGADVLEIIGLLLRELSKTLSVAVILAIPVSYLISHNWLDNFAYKTDLKWWIFVGGGAMILIIALVTVSLQSIKAALMNPVESLRSE